MYTSNVLSVPLIVMDTQLVTMKQRKGTAFLAMLT